MKINCKHLSKKQGGFTIVELMIATSVLSVILLLVTSMMIGIGNLFTKGENQARVQDNVRSITDDLTYHLQMSTSIVSYPNVYNFNAGSNHYIINVYCFDSTRYTYVLGYQIGASIPGSPKHVLWRDNPSSCDGSSWADLTAAQPSANGTELIAPNSRLTDFSFTGSNPYHVSVGVAYGDDDLLTNVTPNTPSPNAMCKGSVGDQFCSTSSLATTVAQRL